MQQMTKDMIDKVFVEHTTDVGRVVALYKLVYPDWDKVIKVLGYPRVSEKTNIYIMEQFIKHHDGLHMAGGTWLNNGFSVGEDIPDWCVKPCDVMVNYS